MTIEVKIVRNRLARVSTPYQNEFLVMVLPFIEWLAKRLIVRQRFDNQDLGEHTAKRYFPYFRERGRLRQIRSQ